MTTKSLILAICSLTITPTSVCGAVVCDTNINTPENILGPTSINITPHTLNMVPGEESQPLIITAEPEGSSNDVIFSSENEDIATVDEDGVITAKKDGSVFIKATSSINPNVVDNCVVYVESTYVPVTGVQIINVPQDRNVGLGREFSLKCKVLPENATFQGVTWSTSDSSKIKINKDGVVTGLAVCEDITITATTDDQRKTASCNLNVWDFIVVSFDCDEHGSKEQPEQELRYDKGTTWAQIADEHPELKEEGTPETDAWFTDGYYDDNDNKITDDYVVNVDTKFTYRFYNTFTDENHLKFITIDENHANLDGVESELELLEELTVPETVTHRGKTFNIIGIQQDAFAFRKTEAKKINLTTSIQIIGSGAFSFSQTQQVYIPEGSQLKRIEKAAFSKTALSMFDLSKATLLQYIGDFAFSDAGQPWITTNLWDAPTSLQYIGERAFRITHCPTKIDLSNCANLKTIASEAFLDCFNLETVIFNCAEDAFVGKSIFKKDQDGQRRLKTITFTDDCPITMIPEEFCMNCRNLEGFKIPPHVTKIGKNALIGCSSLPETIEFVGTSDQYKQIIREETWHPDTVKYVHCLADDTKIGIDEE